MTKLFSVWLLIENELEGKTREGHDHTDAHDDDEDLAESNFWYGGTIR
jgi:hypothetical protein